VKCGQADLLVRSKISRYVEVFTARRIAKVYLIPRKHVIIRYLEFAVDKDRSARARPMLCSSTIDGSIKVDPELVERVARIS
jgi:hypothetical protein